LNLCVIVKFNFKYQTKIQNRKTPFKNPENPKNPANPGIREAKSKSPGIQVRVQVRLRVRGQGA